MELRAMKQEEYLEIVNDEGEVIGTAPRSEIHGNPSLMHRVVHALLFNGQGELLLQKRSQKKDVAPGKWDTSVGGHVSPGEELSVAAKREMEEELGVAGYDLDYLYSYRHSNPYETELVSTYRCIYDGTLDRISFNREEIDEVRFWSLKEVQEMLGKQILSDNFEDEFRTYLSYQTPRASGP
ncbi:MAG TPA: NUDIX domain-containing protein [Thermodesulfovibrionales bacterium]|nr:NUDIX domain-containing protein [Thermodesulfovibrionales bacterium]